VALATRNVEKKKRNKRRGERLGEKRGRKQGRFRSCDAQLLIARCPWDMACHGECWYAIVTNWWSSDWLAPEAQLIWLQLQMSGYYASSEMTNTTAVQSMSRSLTPNTRDYTIERRWAYWAGFVDLPPSHRGSTLNLQDCVLIPGRQPRMRAFTCTRWSLPVTWQRWRSHHWFRHTRKPHDACKPYGSIFYRSGIMGDRSFTFRELRFWTLFALVTLTLTRSHSYTNSNLARIPWRCTACVNINLICQGFRKLSSDRQTRPKLYTTPYMTLTGDFRWYAAIQLQIWNMRGKSVDPNARILTQNAVWRQERGKIRRKGRLGIFKNSGCFLYHLRAKVVFSRATLVLCCQLSVTADGLLVFKCLVAYN